MSNPPAPPSDTADSRSIAIVGGGVSGLAAAYELARLGRRFTLFEASGRLGGVIESVCTQGFVIECGADSWVTEKPWARELAIELGLEGEIVSSNDQWRATYLVRGGRLVPLPEGMRMMVPFKWGPLLKSPLLSWQARLEYLREPGRADELRTSAPRQDEPVADFVRRHFGEEANRTLAGPLLAGIFGGDTRTLSVRAVMPAFVRMEAEHGSLIAALRGRPPGPPQAIFSTLANGLETLVERMGQHIPEGSIHLRERVSGIRRERTPGGETGATRWRVVTPGGERCFGAIVLATPAHVTAEFLRSLGKDDGGEDGRGNGERMAALLPSTATSAIVVAMAFDASQSGRMQIPRGFGFLVPPVDPGGASPASAGEPSLLACTFLDQKFARRAPSGARLLRAFFGGASAEELLGQSDQALVDLARRQLERILNARAMDGQARSPLPEPALALVRRWPRSLPQYTVGHLERIAELEALAGGWRGLRLVGNAYHGVGLPDLIREGRAAARSLAEEAAGSSATSR
jgi:protoporphyrinogen/coproporphyrinogen III oxidase